MPPAKTHALNALTFKSRLASAKWQEPTPYATKYHNTLYLENIWGVRGISGWGQGTARRGIPGGGGEGLYLIVACCCLFCSGCTCCYGLRSVFDVDLNLQLYAIQHNA